MEETQHENESKSSTLNGVEETLTSNEGDKFYSDAEKYWREIPATVDGMLGGFSHISSTDIAGSTQFLHRFIKPPGRTNKNRALDCGSGIGRISKRLLLPNFKTVDLVEVNQNFLDEAKRKYLADFSPRVERFICSGLQNFTPEVGRYDVIWCQWVLGHLTDEDCVNFFARCKRGLNVNGVLIVKENTLAADEPDFDTQDSSFTRSKESYEAFFEKAGLMQLRVEKQKRFPKEIYDVYMFALI